MSYGVFSKIQGNLGTLDNISIDVYVLNPATNLKGDTGILHLPVYTSLMSVLAWFLCSGVGIRQSRLADMHSRAGAWEREIKLLPIFFK